MQCSGEKGDLRGRKNLPEDGAQCRLGGDKVGAEILLCHSFCSHPWVDALSCSVHTSCASSALRMQREVKHPPDNGGKTNVCTNTAP